MSDEARRALRRRCSINRLMLREESFKARLSRVINLFPVTVRFY